MSEDIDNTLPKQDLLLKILRMTTSDNDNVALNAVRRANEFLSKNGWDWDKLVNAKIRIAADPFSNLQTPQSYNGPRHHHSIVPHHHRSHRARRHHRSRRPHLATETISMLAGAIAAATQ